MLTYKLPRYSEDTKNEVAGSRLSIVIAHLGQTDTDTHRRGLSECFAMPTFVVVTI